MKILLVGNYENDEQESMQRFSASMARGLLRAGQEVRTVRPRSVAGKLQPSWRGIGKWLGYVDKFGIFPGDLRTAIRWADVVHICDQASSAYTKYLRCVPHIVTCHDLFAMRSAQGDIPGVQTRWSGRQLQRMICNGFRKAQHIVCVSEATRRDVLRITGFAEHRVSRVYNSLNFLYAPMEASAARARVRELCVDLRRPFLLHVGGNQWYKNRLGVLRIFAHLCHLMPGECPKLVMVGKPWTDEMRRFVQDNSLRDATLELSDIDDHDLQALYSTAAALVFPSAQEGFGWPIIEAQACGCTVLTSNRPPMNEVGGAAAIYVDPEDEKSAAVILKTVLEGAAPARECNMRNAARFTESAMIGGYLSAYEKVQRQGHAARASLVATAN